MTGVVSDSLEPRLDALFQLHPTEFVKARNALATELRKAGDKPAAARVKALSKPRPAAWALNQLCFAEPEVLADAEQQARTLRQLHGQPGVGADRLQAAVAAQRASVSRVVERANERCRQAELPTGLAAERKLLSTVQGWLAGLSEQPPGRMVAELEAGGFEGVGLVAPVPAATPPSAAAPITQAPPTQATPATPATPAPDAREVAEAQLVVERRDRLAAQARTDYRQTQRDHAAAGEQLSQIERQLDEAERLLVRLRDKRDQHQQRLALAQTAMDDARVVREEAETSLADARRKLDYAKGR